LSLRFFKKVLLHQGIGQPPTTTKEIARMRINGERSDIIKSPSTPRLRRARPVEGLAMMNCHKRKSPDDLIVGCAHRSP